MRRNVPSPLTGVLLTATVICHACTSEPSTAPELARAGPAAPLSVTPSTLLLSGPGASKTFTATVQYSGGLTASSSDAACATVNPTTTANTEKPEGSSVFMAEFTVTGVSMRGCTVTVTDKKGKAASVRVSVSPIAFSHPVEEPYVAYQIHVMGPDGQNKTRVSYTAFNEDQPAWSPDRSKIAFVVFDFGGEEIYVMDPDGQNRTRLTNNTWRDARPAWSPDGTRIAFATEQDGNREIYLMAPDGQNPTRLTNNPAEDDWPTWSPDGSKIAFMSTRDGHPEIYVMDADGQNQTRLTYVDGGQPAWSPTEAKIAFTTSRDGHLEIYVMDSDGQHATRLTYGVEEEKPTWSPEGTRIAWECTYVDEICVMDADGQNPTPLTDGSAEEADPAWR